MKTIRAGLIFFVLSLSSNITLAQTYDELVAQGKELYFEQVSCWVCHGDEAEGRIGPSIRYGPSPAAMQEQLDSNPQMAIIVSELNPDADDLVALSTYLTSLSGISVNAEQMGVWRTDLADYIEATEDNTEYVITERDRAILAIKSFDTVLEDWQKRSKDGPLMRTYPSRIVAEYDSGEQVFFPEPGGLYFYENTGVSSQRGYVDVDDPINTNQVVVGDAVTREILVSKLIPEEMRGSMHTTVMSPDGRYVYMVGPPLAGGGGGVEGGGAPAGLRGSATMLKIDALTLEPVKQIAIGGRLHHGQVFQDKYLLLDVFVAEPDGLNVFLYDPETDEVIGGIRASDLGGTNYTGYTDDEFIYVLMQPPNIEGFPGGANQLIVGSATALRPYWVSKLDPETWEVVDEYPHRGYRGDWITIDATSEHIYVPTASSSVNKINTETGEVVWSAPTGVGPYAADLNADQSELWVANKGESSGAIGRTITVVDTNTGRGLATLFTGYQTDHVLLSPNGKEMWSTSNGEGRIYVYDAESREQIDVIDMPHHGDPHGLVWVKYDQNGKSMVVRDQGGFHNGINPAAGVPLLD
tara:strand:+ start:34256 stop:35998 length:1743 start_codon:yes stop_codon:yes gene_type:complete